jgi:uncharacterized protein YjlB
MRPETHRFEDDGAIPNNPDLPVLVYHDVTDVAAGPASCEELFDANGWGGSWRDGVFSFHHFHSVSHEALGVVGGTATIQLGGSQGRPFEVRPGDVLVLPAGTGHCNLGAAPDFLVVGAYPRGQERYDIRRGNPAEHDEALAAIRRVALPEADPVGGRDGALVELWSGERRGAPA